VLIQRVDFKKEDEGKTKKLSDFASKQIKTFDKIRQHKGFRFRLFSMAVLIKYFSYAEKHW
jgi:hypothetical protein